MKGRAFSLSELSAERLELCAARLAASAEKVDRSVIRHLPQLKEGLVRCQIRIDDPSCDQVGTFDDLWRRQDAHPADLYVKLDQQSAERSPAHGSAEDYRETLSRVASSVSISSTDGAHGIVGQLCIIARSKLKSFPIGGSVWVTLADLDLLAHFHRSDRMNFPQREALGLAPYWITFVSVGGVRIVVKQSAFDQEHFPPRWRSLSRSSHEPSATDTGSEQRCRRHLAVHLRFQQQPGCSGSTRPPAFKSHL